jgi:hypothetical protein
MDDTNPGQLASSAENAALAAGTPPALPPDPPPPPVTRANSSSQQEPARTIKSVSDPAPAWVEKSKWKWWHTVALLLITLGIGAFGLWPKTAGRSAFVGNVLLMTAFTTIAGQGTVGFWTGVLIDERNKMSLSRLQMLMWTILVVSGFLTAALYNLHKPAGGDSLDITVPEQLWMLLGISATSLVGSPLILSTKAAESQGSSLDTRNASKQDEEAERTKADLADQGLDPDTVTTRGKVIAWKWAEDARFADLFQGDEIGNAAHLDLGKVQMFFFTIIIVIAYGAALASIFGGEKIKELPKLSSGLVTLLGISHAGYLANKAVPHSAP